MENHLHLIVTPQIREIINLSIKRERKRMIDMGYENPETSGGSFAYEILPLEERFKSDAVDLNHREIEVFQYLLFETQAYLEDRVKLELVPAKYTIKVQGQLDCVNNLLAQIS